MRQSFLLVLVMSGALSGAAHAETCTRKAGPPSAYRMDLLAIDADDSGVVLDINAGGDMLVLTAPDAFGAVVSQTIIKADGSRMAPGNVFGTGTVQVDRIYANGFQTGRHFSHALNDPALRVTPVVQDGKGNGLAIAEYCRAGRADVELKSHAMSGSGEVMLAHYQTQTGGALLVRCGEDKSKTLYASDARLELVAATNAGEAIGHTFTGAARQPFRVSAKGKFESVLKESARDVQVISVAPDGRTLARVVNDINTEGVISAAGKQQRIDFFGEPGWNLMQGEMGVCGEVIGLASKNRFEEFLALDAGAQSHIRSYTDLIQEWERVDDAETFYWAPKTGARRLGALITGAEAVGNIEITAISPSGVAVGSARETATGRLRAIRLVPVE